MSKKEKTIAWVITAWFAIACGLILLDSESVWGGFLLLYWLPFSVFAICR